MEHSAGLAIIYDNKILLCHPTSAKWQNSFSIPKGVVDMGETFRNCAIRETIEEIGISFYVDITSISNDPTIIEYIDKEKKVYKRVHVFTLYITHLEELGLKDSIIQKEQLQLSEVDWAGFLSYDEAKDKIFWRQEQLLDLIKPIKNVV